MLIILLYYFDTCGSSLSLLLQQLINHHMQIYISTCHLSSRQDTFTAAGQCCGSCWYFLLVIQKAITLLYL